MHRAIKRDVSALAIIADIGSADAAADRVLAEDASNLYFRAKRVRSDKATEFVCGRRMLPDLALVTIASVPVETLMFWFYRVQRDRSHLANDLLQVPLVRLSVPHESPAITCVAQCCRFLQATPDDLETADAPLQLLLGRALGVE